MRYELHPTEYSGFAEHRHDPCIPLNYKMFISAGIPHGQVGKHRSSGTLLLPGTEVQRACALISSTFETDWCQRLCCVRCLLSVNYNPGR